VTCIRIVCHRIHRCASWLLHPGSTQILTSLLPAHYTQTHRQTGALCRSHRLQEANIYTVHIVYSRGRGKHVQSMNPNIWYRATSTYIYIYIYIYIHHICEPLVICWSFYLIHSQPTPNTHTCSYITRTVCNTTLLYAVSSSTHISTQRIHHWAHETGGAKITLILLIHWRYVL